MKCRYCGQEGYKQKDVCQKCTAKLPLAKLFVEECKQFKKTIGYEVETNESERNKKNEG